MARFINLLRSYEKFTLHSMCMCHMNLMEKEDEKLNRVIRFGIYVLLYEVWN
jgi:hypothetical protein